MDIADESLKNIGPTSGDMTTCGPSRQNPLSSGDATLSPAGTHARETVRHEEQTLLRNRLSVLNSSVLLRHFALALFSERTRRMRSLMLPGLGGDFVENLSVLATLCCPSDFERVALGLTTDGIGCSCLVKWRTPVRRDFKGPLPKSSETLSLATQLGGIPHPEFVEELMGFPIDWTACDVSATP